MSGITGKLIQTAVVGPGRVPARQPPAGGGPSSYETYYGLVEPPFSLTPGLRFAFNSYSHATALAQVRQSLGRREGLIVVTGEVGTGKTMLCRALAQDSTPGTFASLLLDPCMSADEILEHVLTDFGVMNEEIGSFGRLAPAVPRHQMLILLQRFLASLIPLKGRAVIIIDEAQHLRSEVLEQIRLWSNFETEDTKLLQIVLAGQSELDALLRRPEMRQIQQRITRRCELTPLSQDEVAQYVEHRLWVAHGFILDDAPDTIPRGILGDAAPVHAGVRFTPAAAHAVARISGGIPRLVNLICDRSLEIGCEQRAQQIDTHLVEAAAGRLNLSAPAEPSEARRKVLRVPALPRAAAGRGLAAAAALLLIAAPFAWRELTLSASASDRGVDPPGLSTPPAGLPGGAGAAGTLQTQNVLNVTMATFSSEQRAIAIASRLVTDGYPAFTRREPGGTSYKVIVGPYVSREAGDAARRALSALGVDAFEVQLDNAHAAFSADVRYVMEPPVPVTSDTATRRPNEPITPKSGSGRPDGASFSRDRDVASYEAAIQPALDRMERLAPFLVSAAASPSAPVLKALEETLMTISQSIVAVDVPAQSREAHQLLTSALSLATHAVAPTFGGDRTAQTREALTLIDRATGRTSAP